MQLHEYKILNGGRKIVMAKIKELYKKDLVKIPIQNEV